MGGVGGGMFVLGVVSSPRPSDNHVSKRNVQIVVVRPTSVRRLGATCRKHISPRHVRLQTAVSLSEGFLRSHMQNSFSLREFDAVRRVLAS